MPIPASKEPGCGYLSVHIERSPDSTRLVLAGELDLGSAQAAGDALAGLEIEPAGPLVVDMARVTFVDCSGLSVLLGAYNRACRDDREFLIVDVAPAIRRIFNLTGCGHLLAGPSRETLPAY